MTGIVEVADRWVGALVALELKGLALLALVGLTVLTLRRGSAAGRHWVWLLGVVGLLVLPLVQAATPHWSAPLPAWATPRAGIPGERPSVDRAPITIATARADGTAASGRAAPTTEGAASAGHADAPERGGRGEYPRRDPRSDRGGGRRDPPRPVGARCHGAPGGRRPEPARHVATRGTHGGLPPGEGAHAHGDAVAPSGHPAAGAATPWRVGRHARELGMDPPRRPPPGRRRGMVAQAPRRRAHARAGARAPRRLPRPGRGRGDGRAALDQPAGLAGGHPAAGRARIRLRRPRPARRRPSVGLRRRVAGPGPHLPRGPRHPARRRGDGPALEPVGPPACRPRRDATQKARPRPGGGRRRDGRPAGHRPGRAGAGSARGGRPRAGGAGGARLRTDPGGGLGRRVSGREHRPRGRPDLPGRQLRDGARRLGERLEPVEQRPPHAAVVEAGMRRRGACRRRHRVHLGLP